MNKKKRPRMRRPAPVASLIGAVLAGTPAERILREGRIWLVWADAVGPSISRHAAPATFRDGTLTLTVDNAPWMQQLTFLKRELIGKVNEALGEELVRDIFMKAGKVPPPPPPPEPPKKTRRLSGEEIAWITDQSGCVDDPELREVFRHLIQKDLEHK